MKKQTKQNGITLIALVITIIILLILAGISISALTGSGLFDKTSKAKSAQEMAQAQEELELKIYEATIENKGYLTLQILAEYLDKDTNNTYVIEVGQTETVDGEIPNLSNAKSMIVTYKKIEFEINDKFEVTCLGEATGARPILNVELLDEGLTTEYIRIEIKASISEGSVEIQSTEGITVVEEISETDKICKISKNGTYIITAVSDKGKKTN